MVGESFRTHSVDNQAPELCPYDPWALDLPLREAVRRGGGDWAQPDLQDYARLVGAELSECARLANLHKPALRSFDRFGHRLDEVEFHPAYHRLMAAASAVGVANFAWRHEGRPGAHVARAALMYLHYQADQGTACPLTMTYACMPTLRLSPALRAQWEPKLLADGYEPRLLRMQDKPGVLFGMGMTEKQGGSDVRSNTTRARRLEDGRFALVGHKWFFSAPMCDAFFVLAQTDAGLSCFLLPRVLEDGSHNAIRIQRLKDKLGDWSNASAEVEFEEAIAYPVGELGRGVPSIVQMVMLTRLDCLLGSAGLMRQALTQALHHTAHRRAFGKRLIEQPLMRQVLADLALESEAATALAFRVAQAVDGAMRGDVREAAFARVATAIGKYWVCKRASGFVNEAQECLGGAGYVEESVLPRLYRQAPLNSIWEGSGNIQCLDVLRALHKEPEAREALSAEWKEAARALPGLGKAVTELEMLWSQPMEALEAQSRVLVERLALCLQAAALWRAEDATVAQAFDLARLSSARGLAYGASPIALSADVLLRRAWSLLQA